MLPSLTPSKFKLAAAAGAALLVLAGCETGGPSPYSTTSGSASVPSRVESGEIVSVTPVTIRPDNTYIATGAGAVIGGVAGSTIGRNGSAEEALGTIGGAVLGGLLGNAIGRSAGTREGYAYIVKFGDGTSAEIIQGGDNLIQPGALVNIIYRQNEAVIVPVGSQQLQR